MKRLTWLCAALALTLTAGCGDDPGTPDTGPVGTDTGPSGTDAGTDAGGATDAGTDAGGEMDAGTDAGAADAGPPDAGPPDSGPLELNDANVNTGMCPPTTEIVVMETCPEFTACGGDLPGQYCYESLCIEEDELLGPAREFCMGVELVNERGIIAGRVAFAGTNVAGTVTRTAHTRLEGTFLIPTECTFGGQCMLIEDQVNMQLAPNGTAMCTRRMDNGCDCFVDIETSVDTDSTYTASGGVVTIGTGNGARDFEYCNDGSSFRFREVGMGDNIEPGVVTLAAEPAN